MAKYANGNPDDDGNPNGDLDDLDGFGGGGDDGSFGGGNDPAPNNGGEDGGANPGDAGGNGGGDDGGAGGEDPFEAKWKSRISVLSGKMRAEFGITSDVELDDSLTPEQRYKLMQADYNTAVMESRSKQPVPISNGNQDPTGGDAGGDKNEPDPTLVELEGLFGDPEIAKKLSGIVEGIAERKAAERIKPVETRVASSDEREFVGQVWGGALKDVDPKSQQWNEFNNMVVPFTGGKRMADVMKEAHQNRDLDVFKNVRKEFDRFVGASAPSGNPGGQGDGQQRQDSGQQQHQANGFGSIATGGRRSAASVVSDNANANVDAVRKELNAARSAAEKGEGSWGTVRELQRKLTQAHGL